MGQRAAQAGDTDVNFFKLLLGAHWLRQRHTDNRRDYR
jgi:hypothetical protein